MKRAAEIFCALVVAGFAWCLIQFLSRTLLNSKVERLGETGLPKIIVEKPGVIYCRMKADDFRFPLPPGARTLTAAITSGGFDSAQGAVEIQLEGASSITAAQYERWLSTRLQTGATVSVEPLPGGLAIKFHYFGDK